MHKIEIKCTDIECIRWKSVWTCGIADVKQIANGEIVENSGQSRDRVRERERDKERKKHDRFKMNRRSEKYSQK